MSVDMTTLQPIVNRPMPKGHQYAAIYMNGISMWKTPPFYEYSIGLIGAPCGNVVRHVVFWGSRCDTKSRDIVSITDP